MGMRKELMDFLESLLRRKKPGIEPPKRGGVPGLAKGRITIADDFDAHDKLGRDETFRPGALEHVRMGRMADDATNIQIDGDLIHKIGALINDGDFVLFSRKTAGDALPYPPGAADQNVHQFSLSARGSAIVPHAGCYAQSL